MSDHSKKLIVKVSVVVFFLYQITAGVLFWAGKIREPYPVIILPSFDKVLIDDSGAVSFITAEFYVTRSGSIYEIPASEVVIPGISRVKFWWVLARMLPPEIDAQVSLPSYNYPFINEGKSNKFQAALATAVEGRYEDATSLEVRWVRKTFLINPSTKRVELIEVLKINSVHVGIDDR